MMIPHTVLRSSPIQPVQKRREKVDSRRFLHFASGLCAGWALATPLSYRTSGGPLQ